MKKTYIHQVMVFECLISFLKKCLRILLTGVLVHWSRNSKIWILFSK